MAVDWTVDVRKYVPDADDGIITGIVRHCGIALRNRDSSLVSFSEKTETDRLKASFLRKKLGLTDADEVLDAAIAAIGERMKADRTKNRVTVYFLLADAFGRLEDFRPKTRESKPKAAKQATAVPAVEPLMAPPPPPALEPVAAPEPVLVAAKLARPQKGSGLLWPLTAALVVFGGIAALIFVGSN